MGGYAIAAAYTVFLWWFTTGVILWLDGLPRGTFRWSMLGATAMLLAGLIGLATSAGDTGALGAYCAFTCAILAWAWIETGFLTGFLTGPSDAPCPPDAVGWRRFRLALGAILHHELAILGVAATILAVTWDAPNRLGLWTFLALWGMRQSAKLNLFLGVRNLGEAFLPEHLRHLASFFRRRPMNLLFPVSVSAVTAACVLVFAAAGRATEPTGLTLLGVLLALGLLEHWFLVLPLPFERLWSWYLARRGATDGRQHPAGPASFAAPLDAPCDVATLRRVLAAAAEGDFGEVERLHGLVRDAEAAGWFRFQLAEGRAGLVALAAAGEGEEPRISATGRRLDGARLRAALEARGMAAPLPA